MPGKLPLQQAGQEQESSTGRPRQTLQRRVQNALRWRSWGGESDTAAPALATRPPSGPGRHRAGRSAGSDVELSALPSTTTSSICSDMPVLSSPAATVGSGEQLARSTVGSTKSSTSSAAGAGLANDAGSSGAGPSSSSAAGIQQQQQQQQSTPAIGIPGATDDACSIVTQAGSTAHSFTSLYSMLADQGEAGSETAGPSAAAATAGIAGSSSGHTGGAMSPFRGSDAGGDVGTSVSTLPLISEMAYDDEQQLMQEVDELAGGEGVSGRVSGFDEAEEDAADDAAAAQRRAAQQGALVMSGISGRPRVSSSHGSVTSAASDASVSAPGSAASGPIGAVVGPRMASPAGAGSSFGRSGYSSQRSSGSRHSLHQQQQQLQLGSGDSRSSADLPPPFGMRKRPDNDETCSYATQAGSVHSVSSVLSSAFAESAPQQRTSGSGSAAAAGQQQLLIHPLSEPTDELGCFEEEDASLTAAARSSSAGDGSIDGHHLSLSSPNSSSGQQQGALAAHAGQHLGVDNAWGLDEQQWQQQQQAPGGPAAGAHGGGLERKGSLKGALRSVVAWGSGLGQRLQRGSHEKQAGHKQQQQQQQGAGRAGAGASSSNGPPLAGPQARQQRPASGSQELASM
uniref:Uncharacterized protein n=1 Tax=Tetradesmus obliquus TaxID=3088 RepID=A0A383V3A9_TETOB|eukprot:jgi/Sobl393_1/2910/SZX59400.1